MTSLALAFAVLLGIAPPQHAPHHPDETIRRGDAVMGFSHEKTTHHFRLRTAGGDIDATAKDANDEESVSQIRGHFQHIARMFGEGNFTAPILIHAQDPPGAAVMAARKGEITYTVEMLPAGARIRITTSDKEALEAIHRFLRFQITDHRTGDPLTIRK
jgi:hypothetical protein